MSPNKLNWIFIFLLALLPNAMFGQAWTGLLNPVDSDFPGSSPNAPPAYAVNWANVGVGGIPARSTTCSTLSATGSDQSSAIQSALNNCSSGETVLLNAGTFQIASSVNIPANVTLRGSGANKTILNTTGSGTAPITLGSGGVAYSGALNITNGATSGSTSITLSGTSGVAVGRYLIVSETNNSTYVSNMGDSGSCSWCDGWSTNGTRARGQIVEVTAINGNVVTIAPGLYGSYENSPTAVPFAASEKMAGLENLQIYQNNTGYGDAIYMSRCMYCWIKGVEVNYADGDYVGIYWSYRAQIQDSYFSNAYQHGPGTHDADVFLGNKTSATLIQNNIIERAHVSIMLNWGAAGNVIAYNYALGNFDQGATNFLQHGFDHHGAHPQFNLIEGNVFGNHQYDSTWGTSSHDTTFRNWFKGTSRICNPTSPGRATVTSTCHYANQAARAVEISEFSRYNNFVGDVLGSTEASAQGTPNPLVVWPANRNYSGTVYGWTFGYGGASDTGGAGGDNAVPYTSAFLHGIFNNYDGRITWATDVTHTLPVSFYLASKPSWWGTLPYPATGPDVTGGSGPGGHSYGNPAMKCYLSTMGGVDGGVGSPLTFNASTCYGGGGSSSTPPEPPTGLTVVVQ